VRRSTALIVIAMLVVLAGAAVGGVIAFTGAASPTADTRTALATLPVEGSPADVAGKYLAAWGKGDYATMQSLIAQPPSSFADRVKRFTGALRATGVSYKPGAVQEQPDGSFKASFTATMTVPEIGPWTYGGALKLIAKERQWRVDWSPASVHPNLTSGARLVRGKAWPDRAPIVAADGSRLDERAEELGAAQFVGTLGQATAEDLDRLGDAYGSEDVVGRRGLQRAFQERLAGHPGEAIQVVGPDGTVRKTVHRQGGSPGEPLRTTIEPKVQAAAAQAIAGAAKPTVLVAVRPSSGEILAVANEPVGFDNALLGSFPPGSTFKVVSAAALVAGGLDPSARVACPARVTIGGKTFHNAGNENLGTVSFRDAFAHSCNTTFAKLAVDRLSGERLRQVAEQFGFGAPLVPGLPAVRGRVPRPADDVELAAAAFGQGKVVASPLHMATVAGAIANGTWRPPRLVTGVDVPLPQGVTAAQPRRLEPGVVNALRRLMPAVVNEGTASTTSFPAGTAGKTGTAEHGSGANPPAHAWFIGYRRDLAFAVVQVDGGFGAEVAAPIAANFLRRL
jgi:hypothetical protein